MKTNQLENIGFTCYYVMSCCPHHPDRPVRCKGLCSACYVRGGRLPSRTPEARRRVRERARCRDLIGGTGNDDDDDESEATTTTTTTEAFRWMLQDGSEWTHRESHLTAVSRAMSGENPDRKDGGVHQIHRTMRIHTRCLDWALDFARVSRDRGCGPFSVLDPCAGSGQILEVFRALFPPEVCTLYSNDRNFDAPAWYDPTTVVSHTRHDVFGPARHLPVVDFVVCSPPYLLCEVMARRLVADRRARVAYLFHCTTDFITNANFERRRWWDRFEHTERRALRIEGLPVHVSEGAAPEEASVVQRRNSWIVVFTSRAWKRKLCRHPSSSQVVSFRHLYESCRDIDRPISS